MGWRFLGAFGFLLALIGFSDLLLAAYPMRPGSPDWEFGVIHQALTILPLPTIGLAGMLAAAFSLGKHMLVRVLAVGIILLGLGILALDVVFATVVPLALDSAPTAVLPGLKRAILRTAVAGTLFPVAYLVAGVAALRYATGGRRMDV